MKNKAYIFTALVLTLGISFAIALAGSKDVLPSITFGDNPYTLTISSFDSGNLDQSVNDDIYIAETSSGYPVKFAIDKGANGGHDIIEDGSLYIGKGGYIRNHTEILGIRAVTVNYEINTGSTVARCELGNSPVDFTTSFSSCRQRSALRA